MKKEPITIKIENSAHVEKDLLSIKKWLKLNKDLKQNQLDEISEKLEAGTMGIDPLTALQIILSSAAVGQLIKSIVEWKKVTRSEIEIKIKSDTGEYHIKASGDVVKTIIK